MPSGKVAQAAKTVFAEVGSMSSEHASQPARSDLAEQVDALQQQVDQLAAETERLRSELEAERSERAALEETLDLTTETVWTLEDIVLGEYDAMVANALVDDQGAILERIEDGTLGDHTVIAELEEELDDLEDRLVAEQQTRSQHDSRIERRVSLLADEVDVDLTDATVAGEDSIQRLLKYGPEDLGGQTYEWHHRARDLLSYAGEIGHTVRDEFGHRITITGPDARTELKKIRNETLSSSQVRRVFENIENLAADSPRKVHAKTGETDDVNKLVVYLRQDELEAENR